MRLSTISKPLVILVRRDPLEMFGETGALSVLCLWLLKGKAHIFNALTQSHIFINKSLKNFPYISL